MERNEVPGFEEPVVSSPAGEGGSKCDNIALALKVRHGLCRPFGPPLYRGCGSPPSLTRATNCPVLRTSCMLAIATLRTIRLQLTLFFIQDLPFTVYRFIALQNRARLCRISDHAKHLLEALTV